MLDYWFGVYTAALIGADLILTMVLFSIASPTAATLMGAVTLLLVLCIVRTHLQVPRCLLSQQS
jgi:hypothetical protein